MNSWSAPSTPPASRVPLATTDPQLSRFADAVMTGKNSLLVTGPTTEDLNSLGDSLQSLWQARAPGLLVEHFSGRHSAGLLGHLNAMLAERPLQLAMQENDTSPLQQVCLVKDAECLGHHELLLLKRMMASFPGWPTRVVLLFKTSSGTTDKLEALLSPPSKGLMIWPLDKPTATQAVARPGSSFKLWMAVLVSWAALGTGVVWHHHVNEASPVEEATIPPPAAQAPAAGPEASLPVPGSSDSVVTPALTSASDVSATPLPGSAPPAAPEAAAPVPAAPVPAAEDKAAWPPVPEVAVRGQRWLASLPKDFFLIAHGTHESLRPALRQVASRPDLNNARVIMLKPTASAPSRFMVVTGPFRSLERAQNFSERQKLPASTLILQAGEVQKKSRAAPKVKPG